MAGTPEVWARYQIFTELHRIYNDKLEEVAKVDINEATVKYPGFEQQRENIMKERMTDKDIDEKLADLCLKECHSIMIVGWETDK